MRKALLLIPLLVLSGCAVRSSAAERVPRLYASLPGFTARVSAVVDRGASENDFVLLWTAEPGGSTVEIVKPDCVAGISAVVTEDARTLVCEGAALTLPETLSPLELLPLLGTEWKTPCAECEASDKTVTLVYFETLGGSALELRTRFDAQTLCPLDAAVFRDGQRCALYRFDTFSPL